MSDIAASAPAPVARRGPTLVLGRVAEASYSAPIFAIAFLCVVDLAWNARAGLTFTGWSTFAVGTAILLALGAFYSVVVSRPRVAELAFVLALWTPCNISGGIMSYLAATSALPLVDAALARFDAAIGFDWIAWVGFVRSHEALNAVLRAAYKSLPLQLYGSVLVFSIFRSAGRNEELLLLGCAAAFITSVTAAALPALGPWMHFEFGALDAADTAYVAHVMALRQEHAPTFALDQLEGIVTFPSFHTTLAVLFTYAHRGIRWTLPPVALLNGVMLLSIPSEGGHHLADMIAGALVALAAIAVARAVRRAFRPSPVGAGAAPRPSPAPTV